MIWDDTCCEDKIGKIFTIIYYYYSIMTDTLVNQKKNDVWVDKVRVLIIL